MGITAFKAKNSKNVSTVMSGAKADRCRHLLQKNIAPKSWKHIPSLTHTKKHVLSFVAKGYTVQNVKST